MTRSTSIAVRIRPALLAVLALLLASSTFTFPTSAQARGWMGRTGYAYNGHTLGTLKPPGYSEQAICIDTDADLPSRRTSPARKDKPALNYLVTRYGQTTSNVDAAALAWIIKDELNDPAFGNARRILASLSSATQKKITSRAEAMRTEARRLAGPYRLAPAELEIDSSGGEIRGLGIRTDSGALLAGVTLTLDLSGPARFADGSTRTGLTSSAELQTLAVHTTGVGEVTLSVRTGKVLAGTRVNIHPSPKGTSGQRMVTAGPKVSLNTSAEAGSTVRAVVDSQVSAPVLATGGVVSDTVVVETDPALAGATVKVSTTLWGPLPQAPSETDEPPDGTDEVETLATTLRLDEEGGGEVTLELSVPLREPGWYVFVESVADDDDLGLDGATGSFGRPGETVVVVAPGSIATTVSRQLAGVGTVLTDTVDVTGVVPDLPGVAYLLTGELRGPLNPADGSCEGLEFSRADVALDLEPLEITENGTVTGLGRFTVEKPGCYSYGETLTATLGEEVLWGAEHPVGTTSQTALVIGPSITTVARATSAHVGAVITDTIELSGTSGVPGTISGSLLGPVEPVEGRCTGLDWTGAPLAQELPAIPTTGDGRFLTVGFNVVTAGCYTYTETWTSTTQQAEPIQASTPPGEVSETLLFSPPPPEAPTGSTLRINSGRPAAGTGPATGVGAAVLMAACLTAAALVRRRLHR